MKKFRAILIVVVFLAGILALTGCSDGSGGFSLFSNSSADQFDLRFKNSMEVKIDNLYITPPENEYWGDPITIAPIQKGHTITIDFEKFGGVSGNIYDIGMIDENAMDYDIYEIVLTQGDTLEMSGNSDSATLVITHADGTTTEYEAIIYPNESASGGSNSFTVDNSGLNAIFEEVFDSQKDLHFVNSLAVRVDNLYITSTDNEYWGDPVTDEPVLKGETVDFGFTAFEGVSGSTYDIGLIDENAMDYDIYEVVLTTGDTIEIIGDAEKAALTITHADGSKTPYEVIIYADEQQGS